VAAKDLGANGISSRTGFSIDTSELPGGAGQIVSGQLILNWHDAASSRELFQTNMENMAIPMDKVIFTKVKLDGMNREIKLRFIG
jgi:hypothetical protein